MVLVSILFGRTALDGLVNRLGAVIGAQLAAAAGGTGDAGVVDRDAVDDSAATGRWRGS
ncbi:hypothetical protein [Streptomyces sp. A5-4]|uniref:hypothetical protein n=1 Tax=Streptomyces sp. A5-4 TaxID=3384771 RepID=UPI003DA7CC46